MFFLGFLNHLYAQAPPSDSTYKSELWTDSTESQEKCEFICESGFQERILELFSNREAITRDQIDNSIIRSWGDITGLRAGMGVMNYSNTGQPQILVINGSTQQVGVVSDDFQYMNHSFRFPYVGGMDLSYLPLENIETIELVGPGISALLGEDIPLGAVLIRNKESYGKKAFSRALYQKAPYGFRRTQLELGKNLSSRGKVYFTAGFKGSDGYLLNNDLESMYLTLSGNYILRQDWNMGMGFSRFKGERDVPHTQDFNLKRITEHGDDWGINLKLVHKSSQDLVSNLKLSYYRMNQRFNDSDFSLFREDVEEIVSLGAEHQSSYRQKHNLRLKGSWIYNRLDERSSTDHVENESLLLIDLFETNEHLKFLFCAKLDKVSHFDLCLSPMIGTSYRISSDSRLFFVLGRFYGFPTVRDLYLDSTGYSLSSPSGTEDFLIKGNSNLKAQESLVTNLGYVFGTGGHRFDLNIYRIRLANSVTWENQNGASFLGSWMPLDRDLNLYGINSDLAFGVGKNVKLFFSYAFQKTEDAHAGLIGGPVPEHSLFCFLEYSRRFLKDELRLGGRVENSLSSDYYCIADQPRERQGSINLVDLRLTFEFLDFACYYVIENLNDKNYKTPLNYPAPRRTHWWGFSWRFFD